MPRFQTMCLGQHRAGAVPVFPGMCTQLKLLSCVVVVSNVINEGHGGTRGHGSGDEAVIQQAVGVNPGCARVMH